MLDFVRSRPPTDTRLDYTVSVRTNGIESGWSQTELIW